MRKLTLAFLITVAACLVLNADTRPSIALPSTVSIAVDESFQPPFFAQPDPNVRTLLLPDGKYLTFGDARTLTDQPTGGLNRFNADGTLDTTFSFDPAYPRASAVALTATGKYIVAVQHPMAYGVPRPVRHEVYDIIRVNNDGSLDSTFVATQTTDGAYPQVIVAAPDGKILIGGLFTHVNGQPTGCFARLLPDGGLDPSFAPITFEGPAIPYSTVGLFGIWARPIVDANGKIIIGGDFLTVNGQSRPGVARLNSDGTLDESFVPSGFSVYTYNTAETQYPVRGLGFDSNGKIIVGSRFIVSSVNRVPLLRLNTDGSRDVTYTHYTGTLPQGFSHIRDLVVQPDNKVVAVDYSVWRFDADGARETTFHNPTFTYATDDYYLGSAYSVALGGDGSFLVGGLFSGVDDTGGPFIDRWGVARLNPDGTVNSSFVTSHRTGHRIEPSSFVRRSDSSTTIAFKDNRDFRWGAISHSLGRLFQNGSLDLGFDPIASFNPDGPLGPDFYCLGFTPLADSSLLFWGDNGIDQGGSFVYYGHLLGNDTEDTNYHAEEAISLNTAIAQPDGRSLVSNNWRVWRLNSDGSQDWSFDAGTAIRSDTQDPSGGFFPTAIYESGSVLDVTSDQKVLMTYLSRDGTYHFLRLTSSGSIDSSFPVRMFSTQMDYSLIIRYDTTANHYITILNYFSVDPPVKKAKTLSDGKILLGGSFANYDNTPAHGIVRLNGDGSIDPTFHVGGGAQWTQTPEIGVFHPSVDNIEILPNGQLFLTGTFEAFNGIPAPGIVLLNADGSLDTSFVPPVARQKYDYQPAYLNLQPDGSLLLSGPYARAGQASSPSFLRLITSPIASSIVSRKAHGPAGTFDISLPESGAVGVECRTGGGTNDYQIVVAFSRPVTVNGNPQAQVTMGSADIGSGGTANGGVVSVAGNVVTIPLTNVNNGQTINVTVSQVSNGALGSNLIIPMKILVGDTNGNGTVNASDVALTKSKIGQSVDGTNFRADVNGNGTINASDASLVKSRVGSGASALSEKSGD